MNFCNFFHAVRIRILTIVLHMLKGQGVLLVQQVYYNECKLFLTSSVCDSIFIAYEAYMYYLLYRDFSFWRLHACILIP